MLDVLGADQKTPVADRKNDASVPLRRLHPIGAARRNQRHITPGHILLTTSFHSLHCPPTLRTQTMVVLQQAGPPRTLIKVSKSVIADCLGITGAALAAMPTSPAIRTPAQMQVKRW